MSVFSVTERFRSPPGGDESKDAQSFTRTDTRVFDVLVDSLSDTKQTVLASGLVPVVRDGHPSSIWLRANRVTAEKVAPYRYMVTADYEGQLSFANNNPNGPVLGPLDQPPKLEWDYIVTQEKVSVDVDGDPIQTVCKERFDPPIMIDVYTPVLRVERNILTFNPDLADAYTNKVNSKPFMKKPAGSVRSGALRARNVNDEQYSYWTISIEFLMRKAAPGSTIDKAWWYRTMAEGYLVNFGDDLESADIRHALDDNGNPSPVPVKHSKTSGRKLDFETEDQFYEFEVVEEADFNKLGII